jgi:hypothetical protein
LRELDEPDKTGAILRGLILVLATRTCKRSIVKKISHDITLPLGYGGNDPQNRFFQDFATLSQYIATTALWHLNGESSGLSDRLQRFGLREVQFHDRPNGGAEGTHAYCILCSNRKDLQGSGTELTLTSTHEWNNFVPYWLHDIFAGCFGSLKNYGDDLLPGRITFAILEAAAHQGDVALVPVLLNQMQLGLLEQKVCEIPRSRFPSQRL